MNRSRRNSDIPESVGHSLFRRRLMTVVKCHRGGMDKDATAHSNDTALTCGDRSTTRTTAALRNTCCMDGCPVTVDSAGNEWCWCRTIDARDIGD
jgi:hypothetical protein